MSGNRRKRMSLMWAGMLVGIGLAGAMLKSVWTEEVSLIAQSTRVADVSDWFVEGGCYHWVSSHFLVALNNPADKDWHAELIETSTGVPKPLSVFNRSFGKRLMHDPLYWLPSPDGHFLLWNAGNDAHPTWILSDFSGGNRKQWPRHEQRPQHRGGATYYTYCSWLPDSTHWVEWQQNETGLRVRLYHRERRGASAPFDIAGAAFLLGFTTHGQMVVSDCEAPEAAQPVVLTLLSLADRKSSAKYTLYTPVPGYHVCDMVLSPHGDRIAWNLSHDYVPWLDRLMQRGLSSYPIHTHHRYEIWVSAIDGKRMHRVGYEESLDEDTEEKPIIVEWTPDSKKLSYLTKTSLYTITVGND